jgi:hypothetical protein
MDIPLLVTIGLIFLGTSVVGYVRSRITDRCLRSFHGFQVTLDRTDGRQVWGRMDLSPGGIEFVFPEREKDDRRLKASYLLYAAEFRLIQSIVRHADRLTDAERRLREADIARSFHPGPLRRLIRRIRNFLGSATDSLRDILAIVLGRVQKTQERYVAAEGTDTLTKLGGSVLTEVTSVHDPLLERQIGRQVVLETIEGDEIHEHVGIFKEYSAAFLHLLDVQYPHEQLLDVPADRPAEHGRVSAARAGRSLELSNAGPRPVHVVGLETAGGERPIDALVDPETSITLPLAADAADGRVRLRLRIARQVDIIVPRSASAIRNRAEQTAAPDEESLWDLVFELGLRLGGAGDDRTEARLREQLEKEPEDAAAAAALGAVLLKRQDFAEAGRWLRTAYNGRDSLPDGGRRVRMQLRELARRLAQRGVG